MRSILARKKTAVVDSAGKAKGSIPPILEAEVDGMDESEARAEDD